MAWQATIHRDNGKDRGQKRSGPEQNHRKQPSLTTTNRLKKDGWFDGHQLSARDTKKTLECFSFQVQLMLILKKDN